MFTEMVFLLKSGEIIDLNLLRKRFDRALVKKIGTINTPYPFWPSDPKINPSTKELIWAAILLGDRDSFMLIEGIIAIELDEKRKASGQNADVPKNNAVYHHFIDKLIQDFLDLAPSEDFRILLEEKVKSTVG